MKLFVAALVILTAGCSRVSLTKEQALIDVVSKAHVVSFGDLEKMPPPQAKQELDSERLRIEDLSEMYQDPDHRYWIEAYSRQVEGNKMLYERDLRMYTAKQ